MIMMMMMMMMMMMIILVYLRAQLNSQRPITKFAHDKKYARKYKHGIQNTETCKNDNDKTKM
jgi:cytochrome oxidase Cu insertion factor (SCO1/SenC/PrrC family)